MGLFNALTRVILRSPFHRLRSGNTLLLTFTGRKSGKTYQTPVSYTRDGDTLRTFTARENVWWRNLSGGVAVRILYRGQEIHGTADVFTDNPAHIAAELADHVRRVPRDVKFHGIRWDTPGQPNRDDVARAAAHLVLIELRLGQTVSSS